MVPGQHCHITDQCFCEFLVGSGDDNRPFYDIWPGIGDMVSALLPEMTFPPVVMTLIPMVLTFPSAGIMFAPIVINILPTVRMCPAMMMILGFLQQWWLFNFQCYVFSSEQWWLPWPLNLRGHPPFKYLRFDGFLLFSYFYLFFSSSLINRNPPLWTGYLVPCSWNTKYYTSTAQF